MNERVEVITKCLKALIPIAASFGWVIPPEYVEALAMFLGSVLTLAYGAEAYIKFRRAKKNDPSMQTGPGN
jgi:hypothetical protein